MSTDQGAVRGHREVAFGLDENIAALLAYLVTILVPILLLIEDEDNEYVRFHAAQSLLLGIAMTVGWFVVMLLTIMLQLPFFSTLVWLAWAGITLFMAYQAYEGERYELPVLAEYANDMV